MEAAFTNANKLLRYVLSGFVAIAVACWVDEKRTPCLLEELRGAANSWWPVLFLALTVGCVAYVIHLSIFYSLFYPWLFKRWRKSPKGKTDLEITQQDANRWLRRWGKNRGRDAAVQEGLDEWSSMCHFLYCSSLVTIATPIFLHCAFKRDVNRTNWVCSSILGVVLLVLALVHDRRANRCEHLIDEAWSKAAPEHPRQT